MPVLDAGGGMSKDPDLIYRLVRKRTERVLGPATVSGDNNKDAELPQEHTMHTAGEERRIKGLQTVRVRGQVNLMLRAPRAVTGGEQPPPTLARGELLNLGKFLKKETTRKRTKKNHETTEKKFRVDLPVPPGDGV